MGKKKDKIKPKNAPPMLNLSGISMVSASITETTNKRDVKTMDKKSSSAPASTVKL